MSVLVLPLRHYEPFVHLGKHNCLWCEISSDQLKTPCRERGLIQQRSLQTLQRDYDGFVRAGGDIRHAKDHNNVIQPYFLEISLNQVVNVSTQLRNLNQYLLGVSTWAPHQSWHLLPALHPSRVRVPPTGLCSRSSESGRTGWRRTYF